MNRETFGSLESIDPRACPMHFESLLNRKREGKGSFCSTNCCLISLTMLCMSQYGDEEICSTVKGGSNEIQFESVFFT